VRALIVALALLAAAPATAAADGFSAFFTPHSVQVFDFRDCPPGEHCEPRPVMTELRRAGATVGAAGPALEAFIPMPAQPGDVLHVIEGGVERAAVPYTPLSLDDGSCAVIGSTTLSGGFRPGTPGHREFAPTEGVQNPDPYTGVGVKLHDAASTTGALTFAGDRWTASFPVPIVQGTRVALLGGYTIDTPAGHASILTAWDHTVCPDIPPSPQAPTVACPPTFFTAWDASRAMVNAALAAVKLRKLRTGNARIEGLPSCGEGGVTVRVFFKGKLVAKGGADRGSRVTFTLRRTRWTGRLAYRGKARVRFVVRWRNEQGHVATWQKRVTLRAG
jgi:hypothetical protein